MVKEENFTNRLTHETSPYLRQHAHNPVDWYPWGPEALGQSLKEDKPIFLSIGYSACHWCHVMEHESFEDPETASLMNENFINIKVDREERPDLDQIYMNAIQLLTQHGGWPMSVFLTPKLEPFYGGTYFPPEDKMGMPSFKKILKGVAHAWKSRRKEVEGSAHQLTFTLNQMTALPEGSPNRELSLTLIDQAVPSILRVFDPVYGGLGSAPKFFHTTDLKLSLRHWKRSGDSSALKMVVVSLDQMVRGGIYDQLGGGFHRYSTDARWLVPHFEKMLYDNALLGELYIEAFQALGNANYAQAARETLDYVLREMTSPEGAFFSTQDADSEGVEGKFYVWSYDEIMSVLGSDVGSQFAEIYDVSEIGNWEHHNILNQKRAWDELDSTTKSVIENAREKLLNTRALRIWPGRDEKILTSWNGLMISALAKGYQVLEDRRYLEAAQNAAEFILNRMKKSELLQHCYKDGQSRFNACLDDTANFTDALVSLYESDFQLRWLEAAVGLAQTMLEEFWDEDQGGFFYTGRSHEKLISRTKDIQDGATPSSTAMAVTALIRLGRLTGRKNFLEKAEQSLQIHEAMMNEHPMACGQFLIALDLMMNRPTEVVIVPGNSPEELQDTIRSLRRHYLPNKVVALARGGEKSEKLIPLLVGKSSLNKKTTIYFCENFTCQAAIIGEAALTKALQMR